MKGGVKGVELVLEEDEGCDESWFLVVAGMLKLERDGLADVGGN